MQSKRLALATALAGRVAVAVEGTAASAAQPETIGRRLIEMFAGRTNAAPGSGLDSRARMAVSVK